MSKEKEAHLKEWFQNLQRESWQLELVVSAIAIFLLINAESYFGKMVVVWNNEFDFFNFSEGLFFQLLNIVHDFVFIGIVNLIIHLFLRGLWIGIIGLKSVYTSIDYERLNYSAFFTEKLSHQFKNLDNLILNLDKWCSLIFSFTFLIGFLLFSLLSFLFFLGGFNFIYEQLGLQSNFIKIFASIYLLGGGLYAFDFITFGFIKRSEKLSKWYYPIYKFFGWITLSFLYREVYYTLISNVKKKYLALLVIVYLFGFTSLASMQFNQNSYVTKKKLSYTLQSNVYDNERIAGERIKNICIPSKMINSAYLPLFIRYKSVDKYALQKLCAVKPFSEDGRELSENERLFVQENPYDAKQAEKVKEVLTCFQELWTVYINDEKIEEDMFFFEHPNQKEIGIQMMIPMKSLPSGKNVLKIIRKTIQIDTNTGEVSDRFLNLSIKNLIADELKEEVYVIVPFWKN